MQHLLLLTFSIGCASPLYATVAKAGGTAFLAVMADALFPAAERRATALLLHIAAAGYPTWRLHRGDAVEWRLMARITGPSLVTAFVGGLLVVERRGYFVLIGALLILAAGLMALRRTADTAGNADVRRAPAAAAGAGAGFVSELTGIGGAMFLTPLLIGLRWASPRRAAALAPPFILLNSVLGLAGVLLAGQRSARERRFMPWGRSRGPSSAPPSVSRWMSQQATRWVMTGILLVAGIRLLLR
ncbi:sulfite exporter TauE/SafE family protein [Teichococcus oryzae]|uniref:sulfite exporter TauE/SafE family protein n=1 Tax=Teichococcus oryzae TaxID=1608942 RepID=UPI0013761636|nr:sulfite exporter TauE/SafE family protein [Pseudoroseomonas oryzae]